MKDALFVSWRDYFDALAYCREQGDTASERYLVDALDVDAIADDGLLVSFGIEPAQPDYKHFKKEVTGGSR
ncbi:MAG TPA: hypothetical protein VNL14_16440 [Candidatus Acidoferrales bacterium]|nr:hypothetical protein [Candidatus Acidoferrales bacterium]